MHEAAEWVSEEWVSERRRYRPKPRWTRKIPADASDTSAAAYDRRRDLPALIALWPWEIEDLSLEAHRRLIVLLRRALRRERKRGIGSDWTYDVVRHARLLAAYRCEIVSLEARLASRRAVGRLRPPER